MTNTSVDTFKLASPGHRIGATAVDAGLNLVTFGIGWFVWSLFVWRNGQTPGKYLLKIRVINESEGQTARWGQMCLRQLLIPLAISISWYLPYFVFIFSGTAFGFNAIMIISFVLATLLVIAVYVTDFVWLFGPKRKRLVDYWAKTIVINEAAKLQ